MLIRFIDKTQNFKKLELLIMRFHEMVRQFPLSPPLPHILLIIRNLIRDTNSSKDRGNCRNATKLYIY